MNRLLFLTAIIEAGAGLGLLAVPSIVVRLLLGGEISGAGIPLGRVAGAALFALGVACWLAHYDPQSCAARGLVRAMVVYNLGAVVILGAAGISSQPVGHRLVASGNSPRGHDRLVRHGSSRQTITNHRQDKSK